RALMHFVQLYRAIHVPVHESHRDGSEIGLAINFMVIFTTVHITEGNTTIEHFLPGLFTKPHIHRSIRIAQVGRGVVISGAMNHLCASWRQQWSAELEIPLPVEVVDRY